MGIMGVTLLSGCSGKEPSKGTDAKAALESMTEESVDSAEEVEESIGESSVAAADEMIPPDELKKAFDDAKPYEGEVQIVLHTPSGEDIILQGSEAKSKAAAGITALNSYNSSRSYLNISSAAASSTLTATGYSYSVWNMLDWDMSTCWAEGNPYSEGTMEGFVYYMDYTSKIDGFRIYPGYQKSKKVYRKNILPLALLVQAGGYQFEFNLDDYLMDITNDGDAYWIDCYFSSPVYSDSIYVMIEAVKTFGSNPDYDCCITEFHPFYY